MCGCSSCLRWWRSALRSHWYPNSQSVHWRWRAGRRWEWSEQRAASSGPDYCVSAGHCLQPLGCFKLPTNQTAEEGPGLLVSVRTACVSSPGSRTHKGPLRNAVSGRGFSKCLVASHEEGGKLRRAAGGSGCRAVWDEALRTGRPRFSTH